MVLPFSGSPIVFLGQKQFATCPVTVQIAPGPQVNEQGSPQTLKIIFVRK